MDITTLVYVSFSAARMNDDELKEILEKSRENNQKLGITGMLLYRDGFFIQALEGEKETVSRLYEKISEDPRHTNILKVYQETSRVRSFEDWSMGFNKIEDGDLDDLEGFTDFLNKPQSSFFTEEPNRARTLLNMFKNKTYF